MRRRPAEREFSASADVDQVVGVHADDAHRHASFGDQPETRIGIDVESPGTGFVLRQLLGRRLPGDRHELQRVARDGPAAHEESSAFAGQRQRGELAVQKLLRHPEAASLHRPADSDVRRLGIEDGAAMAVVGRRLAHHVRMPGEGERERRLFEGGRGRDPGDRVLRAHPRDAGEGGPGIGRDAVGQEMTARAFGHLGRAERIGHLRSGLVPGHRRQSRCGAVGVDALEDACLDGIFRRGGRGHRLGHRELRSADHEPRGRGRGRGRRAGRDEERRGRSGSPCERRGVSASSMQRAHFTAARIEYSDSGVPGHQTREEAPTPKRGRTA